MLDFLTPIFEWIKTGDIWMLAFISFSESFISPILPDVLLIPLSLAHPERAIEFALICTGANILGGYIGYGIGYWIGPPAMHRFVSKKYQARLKELAFKRGGWAIFFAAILPIPFKIVSISAGAMRVPLKIFTIAAIFGRAKRFLPIGIILHFWGPEILELWNAYTAELAWGFLALALIGILAYWVRRSPQEQE